MKLLPLPEKRLRFGLSTSADAKQRGKVWLKATGTNR